MYLQLYKHYFPDNKDYTTDFFYLNIPKPDNSARKVVFLSPALMIEYQQIALSSIRDVKPEYQQAFQQHNNSHSILGIKHWSENIASKNFDSLMLSWISNGNKCILDADIKNYYPSIHPTKLLSVFQEMSNVNLQGWFCTEDGLIQGPPPSFWISEYFLLTIDLALLHTFPNICFTRKLDNYRVLAKNQAELEDIFNFLTHELEKLGLEWNPSKTFFRTIQTVDDLELEIYGRKLIENKLDSFCERGMMSQEGIQFAIQYLEDVCFTYSSQDVLDYRNHNTISMILSKMGKNEEYFNLLIEKNEDFICWEIFAYGFKWNLDIEKMRKYSQGSEKFKEYRELTFALEQKLHSFSL